MSNLQKIRDTFERIADGYEDHAALEQEVYHRLLDRTSFHRKPPARILDLGCGTGSGSVKLKKVFSKAQVFGLDTSMEMLSHMRRRSRILKPLRGVCGDMGALPFANRCADMLISNLAAYWCPDQKAIFAEFRRVLRPDGMLLFSTLGPATMRELKQAWSAIDEDVRLPEFPDLMDIGNTLVAAGFREPVMDTEIITLSYPATGALLDELEATGNALLVRGWERRTGAESALQKAWPTLTGDGKYPLGFEIIYGVAFGPQDGQPVKTPEGDVATFSIDALRRSRKKG